jgi:hypothetical protein
MGFSKTFSVQADQAPLEKTTGAIKKAGPHGSAFFV